MIRALPKDKVGGIIRDLRESLGMRQADLASALSTDQGSVSRWELGKVLPGDEVLEGIATLAGVDPSVFQFPPPPSDLVPISPRDAAEIRDLLRAAAAALGDALERVEGAVRRTPGGYERPESTRKAAEKSTQGYGQKRRRAG